MLFRNPSNLVGFGKTVGARVVPRGEALGPEGASEACFEYNSLTTNLISAALAATFAT